MPQKALDVNGAGHISTELSVPKIIGEQNSNTQFQLCANTETNDGGCINLWGNGSTSRPGHISLTAGNGNGGSQGEIRFMQNTGGSFVQNMVVTASGQVGIGVAQPDPVATLHIEGGFLLKSKTTGINEFEVDDIGEVRCRKLDVDLVTIPDFVFEPEYNLMSLEELDRFIQENKHLPNINSAEEYAEIGSIDLRELQLKSLEKIEELTLYVIELQKKISSLEKELTTLKTENKSSSEKAKE